MNYESVLFYKQQKAQSKEGSPQAVDGTAPSIDGSPSKDAPDGVPKSPADIGKNTEKIETVS